MGWFKSIASIFIGVASYNTNTDKIVEDANRKAEINERFKTEVRSDAEKTEQVEG